MGLRVDVVAFARALLSHTTRLFTGGHAGVPLENLRVRPLTKSGNIFRVGIFLKEGSLGSPHVLRAHMGRACGEPNESGLTPMGVELNGRWGMCFLAVPL